MLQGGRSSNRICGRHPENINEKAPSHVYYSDEEKYAQNHRFTSDFSRFHGFGGSRSE
jgi:hypothetical protein